MKGIVIGWLAGALLSALVAMTYIGTSAPNCPTEDSCQIDYQHSKGWVVTEVTP